jgi:hypothetical protein
MRRAKISGLPSRLDTQTIKYSPGCRVGTIFAE